MIYVLRLFEVDAAACVAFTSAFDPGGLWHELAGTLPGHINSHLLRCSDERSIYLLIEFWETEQDYVRTRDSVQFLILQKWSRATAKSYVGLGVFHFRNAEQDRGDYVNFNSHPQKKGS